MTKKNTIEKLIGLGIDKDKVRKLNLQGEFIIYLTLYKKFCGADLYVADLSGAKGIILTLNDYLQAHKVKTTKEYVYLYKIVKDNYQSYFSNNPITYEVGKEYSVDKVDNNIFTECSYGLSVATELWCRQQGGGRILQVKVHWKDIIAVPINTDGKIRVKRLKVIKELKQ